MGRIANELVKPSDVDTPSMTCVEEVKRLTLCWREVSARTLQPVLPYTWLYLSGSYYKQ